MAWLTETTVATYWVLTLTVGGQTPRSCYIPLYITPKCLPSSAQQITRCYSTVIFMDTHARKMSLCTVAPAFRVISINTRTTTWSVWSPTWSVRETSCSRSRTASSQTRRPRSRRRAWWSSASWACSTAIPSRARSLPRSTSRRRRRKRRSKRNSR